MRKILVRKNDMSDFVGLISSYSFLNYFLSGALLFVGAKYFLEIGIPLNSDFYSFIIFYFAGLIMNRIGSLFLEPFLRKVKFINFAKYKDFCRAEKIDRHRKLQTLSSVNNSFRSYTVVFMMLFVIEVIKLFHNPKNCCKCIRLVILLILLLIFLFSYKKQSKYVADYVNSIVRSNGNKTDEKHCF